MSAGSGFGELLRGHRRSAGLSQDELAARTGLSRRGLSDLERGLRQRPYRETLDRLATALHLGDAQRATMFEAAGRRGFVDAPASIPGPQQNLPTQLSSFVGRDHELARLGHIVPASRLVTLAGPGGVGKTRVALQVAASLAREQIEQVTFVDLAALSEPDLVVPTIATALGITEQPGRPLVDVLVDRLRHHRVLLLLDNCEHLITQCASIAGTLLHKCPMLHVLSTSREPLQIDGEVLWHLAPLPVPDSVAPPNVETAAANESVQLFLARAQLVQPSFRLTPDNLPAVVAVCRQLDGIPLALELAAARLLVLSADEISACLGDCLRVLGGASRSAPERQRTLRATLDWSYGLLSEEEKALFRRLSVFSDGWTLPAAEAVCADTLVDSSQLLDDLTALVRKSLVVTSEQGGKTRYRLLEPVRQYAAEHLADRGEHERMVQRHALYYTEEAERIDALRCAKWTHWRRDGWPWLIAETSNIRAVLYRCQTRSADPHTEHELGWRLSASQFMFWCVQDRWQEASNAFEAQLEAAPPRDSRAWFWCAFYAATTASILALFDRSEVLSRGLLDVAERLADTQLIALAHGVRGQDLLLQGRLEEARGFNERALGLSRQVGPHYYVPIYLFNAGWTALRQRRIDEAVVLLDESIGAARQLGDEYLLSIALPLRASAAVLGGDLPGAWKFLLEAESLSAALPNAGLGTIRIGLARLALLECDLDRATADFDWCLEAAAQAGRRVQVCECLEGLALVADAKQDAGTAVKLLAAVQSARGSMYRASTIGDGQRVREVLGKLQAALGSEFDSLWKAGSGLSLDEAIVYARAHAASHPNPAEVG